MKDYEYLTLVNKTIRVEKSTRKILNKVLDFYTIRNLNQICHRLGIEEIYGSIGEGKEAVVFLSRSKSDYYVLKIYKIEKFPMKKLRLYLEADKRFIAPKSRSKMVFIWCRKEFSNLKRAFITGVRCPKAIMFSRNIIVMSLIGQDGQPAPKLSETELKNPKEFLEELLKDYEKLVKEAQIVHADLSPFNVLVLGEEPYIIDFSQSIRTDGAMAMDWLRRDLENIKEYFEKKYNIGFDLETMYKELLNHIG